MTSSRVFVELNDVVRAGMIAYPGLPAPTNTPHLTRDQPPSVYAPGTEFAMDVITMIGNTGTYLDSPHHRFACGTDLAGLPLASLVDLPALDELPDRGARFTAVPPGVAEFGTFPVRAFATVDRSRIEGELTSTHGGS